jgi:hypothetical protein
MASTPGLQLSSKWCHYLLGQPETGMGYQVVTVTLKDGRRFEQAVVAGGLLTQIRELASIPFAEDDIADLAVTHAKWDWRTDR